MRRLKVLSDCRGRLRLPVVGLLFLLGVGVLAFWVQDTLADPRQPEPEAHTVTIFVQNLMESRNFSGHRLDDEMSRRCLDTFLKNIDRRKIFFYQSDIDEFMLDRDQIDDQIKEGDTRFAHRIFARFLQRVDEHTRVIDELLDMEHDFTIDEELIEDRDLLSHPKDAAEAHDRWRKRIKYDLLVRKSAGKPEEFDMAEAVEKVRKRHHGVQKRAHQTTSSDLLEMYLTALTLSFDPHSTYMSADTQENFEIGMKLELDGIGASLQSVDGLTVVMDVISGGAADKHGKLRTKDKIVSVGQGEEGEMVDVVDMRLTDVVKLIRGKRGTIVRLGVVPGGKSEAESKIYTITRERIELKGKEARSEIIRDIEEADGRVVQLKKADGSPFSVGWIDLPSFYMDMAGARSGRKNFKSATRDVERLLDEFRQEGVDAVVVDLRRNGGGALPEAVRLTGLFIDRGPVVQVKGPDGRVIPYDDQEAGMAWSGPLVVMVDRFSASASEIFAGAIQDYGRGLIVGDRSTHGKGTVQQLYDLGDVLFNFGSGGGGAAAKRYGALKMTIQKYYRPSGDSTQNRGVISDIELPSIRTHLEGIGEADLDYAMEFDQVDLAQHALYELAAPDLIQELRQRSATRVAQSEDFAKVLTKIQKYKEQVARKGVSLNEEKFLARRAELSDDPGDELTGEAGVSGSIRRADDEGEPQADDESDPGADDEDDSPSEDDDSPFLHDYYFREAMSVTRDYVNALNKNKIAQRR